MASDLRLAEATDGGKNLLGHVALARGAKGKALAAVLERAVADANCLVLGELLALPAVKELAKAAEGSEELKRFAATEAIAYGTYREYREGEKAGKLPPLTESAEKKLRQLTIASLAYDHQRIPYSRLMEELEMNDLRALEDLVIDAVYLGVVAAKLDQKNQCIVVSGVMGRDLRFEDIGKLGDALASWSAQSEALIQKLNSELEDADKAFQENKDARLAHDTAVQETKDVVKATMDADQQGLAGYDPGMMMGLMGQTQGGPRRGDARRRTGRPG
jgi:COP9 signalosome complex subunit 7